MPQIAASIEELPVHGEEGVEPVSRDTVGQVEVLDGREHWGGVGLSEHNVPQGTCLAHSQTRASVSTETGYYLTAGYYGGETSQK